MTECSPFAHQYRKIREANPSIRAVLAIDGARDLCARHPCIPPLSEWDGWKVGGGGEDGGGESGEDGDEGGGDDGGGGGGGGPSDA